MKKFIITTLVCLTLSAGLFSKPPRQEAIKHDIAKIIGSLSLSAFCTYSVFALPHASAWKNDEKNNDKNLPKKFWPVIPLKSIGQALHKNFPSLKIAYPVANGTFTLAAWLLGKYGLEKCYSLIKKSKR